MSFKNNLKSSLIVTFCVMIFSFSAKAIPQAVYKNIYDSVNRESVLTLLQQMTGYLPVTVNGQTFKITNRYSPEAKAQFRLFWKDYFQKLGIPVQELAYTTRHSIGEKQGHNLEAVLEGKTKDSVVIIVHYDSMGPDGEETLNPGVDDDMTGMAIMLETARLLAPLKGKIQNTIRFVAADYEEQGFPGLEGARQYAAYIKSLAQDNGFKLVAAVDNEQTGWNCAATNECRTFSDGNVIDVYSCSGDRNNFRFDEMGDLFENTVKDYSTMQVKRACIGAHSDHYAMWEIGVPAVVYSEHDPFANPHFDSNGGDTFDKIDQNYFFKISQIGVTFAAQLAGLEPL